MRLAAEDKQIFHSLNKLQPSLGKRYLGALYVLQNKRNPDRIFQSAHSVREMLAIISRLSGMPRETVDKEKGEGFKKKVMKVIDPHAGPPKAFQHAYNRLASLNQWFVGRSHHPLEEPTEEEYNQKLNELRTILLEFFKPYFEIVDEIDRLIIKNPPTEDDMIRLKELIKYYQLYWYFFENADERWFNLLARERLFFQTAPVVVAKENGKKFRIATGIEAYEVNVPTWPESRYLARIANKKPGEVFEIISKCKVSNNPNERNVSVIRDFMDAGTKMSDEYAYKMVFLFLKKKWFGIDIVIDQKLVELVSDLIGKRNEISDTILDTLLEVTKDKRYVPIPLYLNPSGKPHFENYIKPAIYHFSYMRILNEIIPSLNDKTPFLTVDILTKKLSRAIYLDSKINKEKGNENTRSDLWRPAVESSRPTDDDTDVKSILVTSLRNSLRDVLTSKNQQLIRECMNRISKEQHKIFRRIELYCYRTHPDFFNSEITNAVLKYLDDTEVFHEYYHLLKSVFKILPKRLQNRYLRTIEKGPNPSVVRSWKYVAKGQLSKDQLENNKKKWKVLKLEPIEDYLPPKIRRSYDKMLQEVGKQSFGRSLFYSKITTYDPEDSSGSQLSEDMKPEDIMNFIKTYELDRDKADMLYDPNVIRFEDLVSKEPFAYSQQSLHLVNTHYTFFYKFFSGLNKANLERNRTGEAPNQSTGMLF